MIGHMFDGFGQVESYIQKGYHDLQLNRSDAFCIMISLVFLILYDLLSLKKDVLLLLDKLPKVLRWCIYYLFVIMVISLGEHGSTQFVYFQF